MGVRSCPRGGNAPWGTSRIAMTTKRIRVEIPDTLLAQVEAAAEISESSRDEMLVDALRAHLAELCNEEAFKQALAEGYLEGEIGYDVLEAFVGADAAASVRASRDLLDRHMDIVGELDEC